MIATQPCSHNAVVCGGSAGPCFILYNGVLRAMASGGVLKFGRTFQHMIGWSVNGRFTTTLHCINSGVIKMSRWGYRELFTTFPFSTAYLFIALPLLASGVQDATQV